MPSFKDRFLYIFFFLFLSTIGMEAQGFMDRDFDHTIGYSGVNIINPGVYYSLSTTLKENPISFFGLPNARVKSIASYKTSLYWDPFSHIGLLSNLDYIKRLYLTKQFSTQMGFGFGGYFSFVSDVYSYENGSISHKALQAYAFWTPNFSIGWQIDGKNGNRNLYNGISCAFPLNFNVITIPIISYEIGIQF